MKRLTLGLLAALAALGSRAEGAAPPVQGSAALDREMRARVAALGPRRDARPVHQEYAARHLALAERYPDSADAFDALIRCLRLCGESAEGTLAQRALRELQKRHVANGHMMEHAKFLGRLPEEDSSRLLRAVMERHPDRRTRARACQALAQGRLFLAAEGEALKPGSPQRDHLLLGYAESYQRYGTRGEAYVDRLVANAANYRAEGEAMSKVLRRDFPGVFPEVAAGKPAPEVVSRDLDGKEVRLSELRGKVVVLDVWTTWCGPCRAMIPRQRAMVNRLKGKPFTLVSVSADESREALARFLKKTPMPWTHWWDGPRGMVIDWDISGYPDVYVIDHKGVIRLAGRSDEEVEKLVDQLLKEMEAGKEEGVRP